jgi:tripartite-type tricarboxylate transporter receptor subunit TctC
VPGFALDVWMGLTMSAKVPAPVVAKVNADLARIVNAPEVKARLAAQGIDVATGSPEALARLIRDDDERWGKIVKTAGMRAE